MIPGHRPPAVAKNTTYPPNAPFNGPVKQQSPSDDRRFRPEPYRQQPYKGSPNVPVHSAPATLTSSHSTPQMKYMNVGMGAAPMTMPAPDALLDMGMMNGRYGADVNGNGAVATNGAINGRSGASGSMGAVNGMVMNGDVPPSLGTIESFAGNSFRGMDKLMGDGIMEPYAMPANGNLALGAAMDANAPLGMGTQGNYGEMGDYDMGIGNGALGFGADAEGGGDLLFGPQLAMTF